MKRSADKRRKRLLRSLFLADPYRKLVAVGLAVALWYFLDSQISDTYSTVLRLAPVEAEQLLDPDPSQLPVEYPPVLWTERGFQNALTDEPIQSVTLEFGGPKHLIQRLQEERPTFVARNTSEQDLEQQGGFEFSAADIRIPFDYQGGIDLVMRPSRVKLVLERNKDEPVVLTPDRVEFVPPPGVDAAKFAQRLRLNEAEFTANEIFAFGPADDVQALQSTERPFRVELGIRSGNEDRGTGVLRFVDSLSHFSMQPPVVSVTVPLQPEPQIYELTVPVQLDDWALAEDMRGRFEVAADQRQIDVSIRATGNVANTLEAKDPGRRQDWAEEFVRLYVLLENNWSPGEQQEAMLLILAPNTDHREYQLEEPVLVNIVEKE